MNRLSCLAIALLFLLSPCQLPGASAKTAARFGPTAPDDPYLWLEDVTGEKALSWVRAQNAACASVLQESSEFEPLRRRLLDIYNSEERIPHARKRGQFFYNFWRDAENPRGVWHRTSLKEYRKPAPAWELVLDLDQLAEEEKENWIWEGAIMLRPDFDRCLISLSRGGADASVFREFDLLRKEFVKGGFMLPEAKSSVAWRNRDVLYVATDFGPGTLTKSGWPRILKEWTRGTPLTAARTVMEGEKSDVGMDIDVWHDCGRVYEVLSREVTLYSHAMFVRKGHSWMELDVPTDCSISLLNGQLLVELVSDWAIGTRAFPAGSLLAVNFEEYLRGYRKYSVLFEPTAKSAVESIDSTKSHLIVNELDNVRSRSYVFRSENGEWNRTAIDGPPLMNLEVSALDPEGSDELYITVEDFLTPPSVYLAVAGRPEREKLKELPALFNADGLEVQQHEAMSKDGTRIPYFQVGRRDLQLDGRNPTLLYGYGAFGISQLPEYDATLGAAWLERGGTYVLANIRGGGEFGPTWYRAARQEKRHRSYEDFIAVAEYLIARKVTSPAHLGIRGGSNGGLLVGVMLTQRPDLFGAVVCDMPVLDMKRYHKLLAGAAVMAEYGNPDEPAMWNYLRAYSPYQRVERNQKYPPVLFTTSTRDDRVHPAHARKMAARMKEQGHQVLFYENSEGGHRGAANKDQAAFLEAMKYTFLWKELRR